MPLIDSIPLVLRGLPALGICVTLVGVLIFVVRHPVNGDEQVIELTKQNVLPIGVALAVSTFLLVPTYVMLAVAMLITGSAYAGQGHVGKLIEAALEEE